DSSSLILLNSIANDGVETAPPPPLENDGAVVVGSPEPQPTPGPHPCQPGRGPGPPKDPPEWQLPFASQPPVDGTVVGGVSVVVAGAAVGGADAVVAGAAVVGADAVVAGAAVGGADAVVAGAAVDADDDELSLWWHPPTVRRRA